MSQADFEIANQGFPSFRSDLNSNLQALASNSAGATEPSSTYAYQFWYDETTDLLKLRNSDDDAWITLAAFDQTNDEWEIRSAVIQAVDSAGVVIKTDDGTTRIEVQDDGDVSIDSGTLFVDASADSVGIGTSSPSAKLDVVGVGRVSGNFSAGEGNANSNIRVSSSVANGGAGFSEVHFGNASTNLRGYISYQHLNDSLQIGVASAEAMRIESSGNLLVGTTTKTGLSSGSSITGHALDNNGIARHTADGSSCLFLNRHTSDGDIALFRKDGSTVGSTYANNGDLGIGTSNVTLRFYDEGNAIIPRGALGAVRDNAIDLGESGNRFDDIYATNGTIQTSDRNEKQDIEELSEAEQRVAVAAKGLLRKFRWKSAVEEKGDDARIHFGIIAQDLQAAFEAEGLDAGRYAMFIYSEWWETYTDVPAVEAVDAVYETVTDEEGNETQVLVSEAVEAKEAYTRTDTYDTEEEAPEGAVKKSRMGVRYSELLAFIIAAI